METTVIKHLTPANSRSASGTERWWQRQLPELHKLGKIGKRGRLFFGDLRTSAEWLACDEDANQKRS